MLENVEAELLWFLVGLVLILGEMAVPGFVIIFFGAGAWVTALLTGLGITESFNAQLLTFLVSSILSLVLFRKQGKKYFEGKVSGASGDLDDVKGQHAVALNDIVPGKAGGEVEFNGSTWKAESESRITKGSDVEIVERKNLTLKVKSVS
jgi:membrane protein implicated in regulation of membrane protease activity